MRTTRVHATVAKLAPAQHCTPPQKPWVPLLADYMPENAEEHLGYSKVWSLSSVGRTVSRMLMPASVTYYNIQE